MIECFVQIKLESPALTGSGEGYGAVIDSDVVFDDLGLPFIPARRVKGCLREVAVANAGVFGEVLPGVDHAAVAACFGVSGLSESAPLVIESMQLDEAVSLRHWLSWCAALKPDLVNRSSVLGQYCEIRRRTAIDSETGTAEAHSLRSARLVRKGHIFRGEVRFREEHLDLLVLAVHGWRGIGTSRTRGFGELTACLLDEHGKEIGKETIQKLEAVCAR